MAKKLNKILINFPPGGGGRTVYSAIEILLGEFDSLKFNHNGGMHNEDNPDEFNRGKHFLPDIYAPFKPKIYEDYEETGSRVLSDEMTIAHLPQDQTTLVMTLHAHSKEIQENLNKLEGWKVLKIDCNTWEEAIAVASRNMIKFRIPMGFEKTVAEQRERVTKTAHGAFHNFRTLDTLTSPNIIQASFNEFWNNPIEYLLHLVDNIPEDRIELCSKALSDYINKQKELPLYDITSEDLK